MAKYMQETPGF